MALVRLHLLRRCHHCYGKADERIIRHRSKQSIFAQ